MRITRNMKLVLDAIIKNNPTIQKRFYSSSDIFESLDMDESVYLRTLDQLTNAGLINPVSSNAVAFDITEYGFSYKELQWLDSKEKWKERIIGFVTGAVLTLLAWFLTYIT